MTKVVVIRKKSGKRPQRETIVVRTTTAARKARDGALRNFARKVYAERHQ